MDPSSRASAMSLCSFRRTISVAISVAITRLINVTEVIVL